MAETKEILVEVKPDLKDAKTDSYLKNWVNWMKCYVQIDAIECFPCYLKISFYHENDANREFPFSVIRLNIPGVRVGSAASRTRSHTYGIFWKSRKRCRLFMAFPDKQSSASHMDWLKRSIDSLENYRKEILERHRLNRSVLPAVSIECSSPEDNLNSTRSSLNDTQFERDMNDILGPLPDIPVSVTECSRWSVRRSSGCSGIYEEILDQSVDTSNDDCNKNPEKDGPRGSIVSAIYVDMSSPIHPTNGSENIEMPPPLPPRRRIYNSGHTPISSQNDGNAKNRRPWNIKNIVFGRTKPTGADGQSILKKSNEFIKSQTTEGISKIYTEMDGNSNLLANCMNSFSTPDLTNIIDMTSAKVPTTSNKGDIDEIDLDVMDIERSNSLNCSTNQFMCRPSALNISSNILWSHNLSVTMSSTCDSSAINLVGANVNNADSFLGHDMSGYCRMAPIINKTTTSPNIQPKLERTSTMITPQSIREHNQQMNSSSIYCLMAPIFRSSRTDDEKIVELTKNITFERHFEFDEECSMNTGGTDAPVAQNDETSSSGVSSDDGMCTLSHLNTTKSTSICDTSMDHHDDAISLTYTESPPIQSAHSNQLNELSFTYQSSKFDEKLPSYFPNENTMNPLNSDSGKYTAKLTNKHNNCGIETPKSKPKTPQHINNNCAKTANYKTVMKSSPADGKAQKVKQRRNTVSEMINHIEDTKNSYPKENWCIDSKRTDNRKYKSMPKPKAIENKKVLLNLDPNTKFEKNLKITRVSSSPRRIYNKCTIRIKTPPTKTIISNYSDSFNSSFDSNIRISNGELSSGGLIRSWTRFRRIDFSPLKTKITSILQRTNSEI